MFTGDNLGMLKARSVDAAGGIVASPPLFTFQAKGSISSGPVIVNGMVFFGAGVLDGSAFETHGVYALKLP